MIVWNQGVPWLDQALESARAIDAVGPVTEVARNFIAQCQGDPTMTPKPGAPTIVTHGDWIAMVSADLIVIGHGRAEKASPAPPEKRKRRKGGRGPKTYSELEEWLSDEGYAVVDAAGRSAGHRQVLDPRSGKALVTLAKTSSDPRTLPNDVAECRRVLGLELRRHG